MRIWNKLSSIEPQGRGELTLMTPGSHQVYVDTRYLWKGTTLSQDKNYEAIKQSCLMNENRKATFIKFNYRHCEDKNLNYPEVFKAMMTLEGNKSGQGLMYMVNDNQRGWSQATSRKQFAPKPKSNLFEVIHKKVKDKQFDDLRGSCEWLDEHCINNCFQQSISKNNGNEEENKPTKKQQILKSQRKPVPMGTMNVCDLWGEKQLKQSLGFLPCCRDRPKILKMYSNRIKEGAKSKKKLKNENTNENLFEINPNIKHRNFSKTARHISNKRSVFNNKIPLNDKLSIGNFFQQQNSYQNRRQPHMKRINFSHMKNKQNRNCLTQVVQDI